MGQRLLYFSIDDSTRFVKDKAALFYCPSSWSFRVWMMRFSRREM